MLKDRRILLCLLITIAAMALGAALRMRHISELSMSHPEMYVPGIPGSEELSVPTPRMDLGTVVKQTLYLDTHPPGYYVLMLYVTRFFGSSTMAIRMPSVIFGVASIGLLFWLGILVEQPVAACLASVFLTLNGFQIAWGRTGRMYAMLCFLGLATTILLLILARSEKRRRSLEVLYAILTLIGLATQVFYWTLLATQMVWVLVNALMRRQPIPRLLNIQTLVAILGSPLVAFAAYQSGNPVAELSRNVPQVAREYLQFDYLIPGWDDTFDPAGVPSPVHQPQFLVPRIVFFLFSAVLLFAGIRRLKSSDEPMLTARGASFTGAWLAAAAVAMGAILAHVILAQRHLFPAPLPTLKYTKAMTPVPLLLALIAMALKKSWDRVENWFAGLNLKWLEGGAPLVLMLALVPVLFLAIVSMVRPLMDPRGLVFLAPYLFLTLAAGVVSLARRSTWIAISLFLILGALHGYSTMAYSNRLISPVDYREFADKLKPRLRSDDLIFLHRDWYTSPILYYLTPDRYHLRATAFEDNCRSHPNARIWALLFRGESFPDEMKKALNGYHPVQTVEIFQARAVLYCRESCR